MGIGLHRIAVWEQRTWQNRVLSLEMGSANAEQAPAPSGNWTRSCNIIFSKYVKLPALKRIGWTHLQEILQGCSISLDSWTFCSHGGSNCSHACRIAPAVIHGHVTLCATGNMAWLFQHGLLRLIFLEQVSHFEKPTTQPATSYQMISDHIRC